MLPKFATLVQLSLQRCALEGVIDTKRGPLRVYSIHLTHLSDATAADRRDPRHSSPRAGRRGRGLRPPSRRLVRGTGSAGHAA
jgi:hypothetical protein